MNVRRKPRFTAGAKFYKLFHNFRAAYFALLGAYAQSDEEKQEKKPEQSQLIAQSDEEKKDEKKLELIADSHEKPEAPKPELIA